MKIINKIFLVICLLLCIDGFCAIKFDKEADKGEWVKKQFLNKEIRYRRNQPRNAKKIMNDFVNQRDVEYIEPIAEGVDINDSNIAKYNIACPKDKPINVSRIMVDYYNTSKSEYEEEINICLKNMKIYNINPYSGIVDNKEYILYCENNIRLKSHIEDPKFDNKNAVFLNFSTEKCEYSKQFNHISVLKGISGLFRYHGKIYFYTVDVNSNANYSVMISRTGFVVGADIY